MLLAQRDDREGGALRVGENSHAALGNVRRWIQDLPAELLTANARAVVVPDASMTSDARALMCEQLRAVGFSEVTMLSKPVQPSDAGETTPRVVAA